MRRQGMKNEKAQRSQQPIHSPRPFSGRGWSAAELAKPLFSCHHHGESQRPPAKAPHVGPAVPPHIRCCQVGFTIYPIIDKKYLKTVGIIWTWGLAMNNSVHSRGEWGLSQACVQTRLSQDALFPGSMGCSREGLGLQCDFTEEQNLLIVSNSFKVCFIYLEDYKYLCNLHLISGTQ